MVSLKENVNARIESLLSKENIDRLKSIENQVKNIWGQNSIPYFFFTAHDHSHSEKVLENIFNLIPEKEENKIKEHEWFVLLASAWLHDIGMKPGLFDSTTGIPTTREEYLRLRDTHHERSAEFIKKTKTLKLEFDEKSAIKRLCIYHRKKEPIEKCKNIRDDYRCQMLASILRIADSMHIDRTRVGEYIGLYDFFLTLKIPISSELHWIKSFCIGDIKYYPAEKEIKIYFYLDDEEPLSGQDILIQHVKDEIEEEVDSCKQILIKNNILPITKVSHEADEPPDEDFIVRIKQVISHLSTEYAASSSELCDIVIETIQFILEEKSIKKEEAIHLLDLYLKNDVNDLCINKPCNTLLKKIYYGIDGILAKKDSDTEKEEQVLSFLNDFQNDRSDRIRRMAENSQALFNDPGSILLFSYSSSVVTALKNIPDDIKQETTIYVCECSNKNRYNYNQKLIHCDAKQYCKSLASEGFKKIFMIPDILSGTIINEGKISKVLFGAIVIDPKAKMIGDTAGHYSIIQAAKNTDVPIYVLADGYKFGYINNIEEKKLNAWYFSNYEMGQQFTRLGVELYNPKHEFFRFEDIDEFVTEEGVHSPQALPVDRFKKLHVNTRNICKQ